MPSLKPEIQYANLQHQQDTAEFGMWVFLATEVLFFGGLTLAYLVYRSHYPADFAVAAKKSVLWIGGVNTAILLTSSLTMVIALQWIKDGNQRLCWLFMLVTAFLGTAFMGLKAYEYYEDYADHVVPLLNFHLEGARRGPAELFWLFYFYATGLHAVHLTIGIVIVLIMTTRVRSGAYSEKYYGPLEVTGLYWSFIDIVWVFLFSLIYPIGRGG